MHHTCIYIYICFIASPKSRTNDSFMFTRWLVCLPGFMAQYSEDSAAGAWDCWTLVDFDGDGDLDLVKTRSADPKDTHGVRKVMYYEQAGDGWGSRDLLGQTSGRESDAEYDVFICF